MNLADDAIDAPQLAAQRQLTERASDVRLAIWSEDNLDCGAGAVFDRMCKQHDWSPDREATELERTVLNQFLTLLPTLGLVGAHTEDTAEFHWARVRCLLAGAGYPEHAAFCERLNLLYGDCPMQATETRDEWLALLGKAHGICGWPVVLGWMDYAAVAGCLPLIDKDVYASAAQWATAWLRVIALLHLLKHARHDARGHVAITYRGQAVYVAYDPGTNLLSKMRRLNEVLLATLRVPSTDRRRAEIPPLGEAMRQVFAGLPASALLRRTPLALLPGTVLAGSWTRLVQCPENMKIDKFSCSGLRLQNCWIAMNGVVNEITGGDEEVIPYAWNMHDFSEDDVRALKHFREALPTEYKHTGFPSDILFEKFRNVEMNWSNPVAFRSIIDGLICMGLLRADLPASRIEFPLTIIFPSEPTPDASTNQGKTTFAHCLARAITIDVPCTQASDVDSAPASRSLAAAIERYGSLCLDEYRPIKSKSHLLAHDSLQALCTGQSVNMGKVMSNESSLVYLRQGLVASCKCADFPPDIVNRSVFLWLNNMGDAQRADVETAHAIATGEVSLSVRLAAVACIERLELARSQPRASQVCRFPVLFGLVCDLFRARTKASAEDTVAAVEQAFSEMRARYHDHFQFADDSGLLAMQEDAQAIRLRATTIFDGITGEEIHQLQQLIDARADASGRWTAAALLKARGELAGLHPSTGLARIAGVLTGNRYSSSDRAVSLALSRDLGKHLLRVGSRWMLPDLLGMNGWYVERVSDAVGATMRFRLVHDAAAADPGFSAMSEIL